MENAVGGVAPLGGGDVLQRGQIVNVVVGQAQSGQHVEVHQVVMVVISVGGVLHHRGGGAQAGQKSHRQGGQQQQGEEAAPGLSDLPQRVGNQAVVLGSHRRNPLLSRCSEDYHSISSTGVGWSVRSTAATVPFLMWMTRSAMGVRAVLWVMTTTVMPCLRQVSWSSLRICLPVT